MGEFFKPIIKAFEKKSTFLFDSHNNTLVVERFQDAKKERPRSADLQKAHPELYDFLIKKKGAKKFNVGIFHIDGGAWISEKLALAGKNPRDIIKDLKAKVMEDFTEIAEKMKSDPSSELGELDFLTAYSVLANHESTAKELGFEIFEIDDDEEKKFDGENNKYRDKTYKAMSSVTPMKNVDQIISKRLAKIALISKAKILELYGKDK